MNTADSQYYTIAAKEMKRSISTTMFSYIPENSGRDSKLIRNYQKLSVCLISLKNTGRRTFTDGVLSNYTERESDLGSILIDIRLLSYLA